MTTNHANRSEEDCMIETLDRLTREELELLSLRASLRGGGITPEELDTTGKQLFKRSRELLARRPDLEAIITYALVPAYQADVLAIDPHALYPRLFDEARQRASRLWSK